MLHLYCVLVPCGSPCSAMFLEVQLVGLLSVIVALSSIVFWNYCRDLFSILIPDLCRLQIF